MLSVLYNLSIDVYFGGGGGVLSCVEEFFPGEHQQRFAVTLTQNPTFTYAVM